MGDQILPRACQEIMKINEYEHADLLQRVSACFSHQRQHTISSLLAMLPDDNAVHIALILYELHCDNVLTSLLYVESPVTHRVIAEFTSLDDIPYELMDVTLDEPVNFPVSAENVKVCYKLVE